jgi:hypothetical protein
LVRVAFGPSLVALVVIAAVVLVQLVVANSDLTGTFGAVASIWLAVHLVPVSIAGQQIGALPLVPVALMVWATARRTAAITPPRGSWFVLRWIVLSAVGGPLLLAALALAVVHDAASVIPELQTPNALRAFAGVLAVSGLGALIGVGSRIGPRLKDGLWDRLDIPGWVIDAIRPALVAVATLLALSGVLVAASLVVHWGTMQDLYGITDSFFGQLSLTVLSLLYLPNVVLGAAAVAVGSSAHIGFATFSAFTVFGGDIPALPILAAAPAPPLGAIWVSWLIIGAIAGVAIGQQCALRPLPFGLAFAKLAVASLLAAVILALLAWAGSGPLGNFGHVGVDQATFAPWAFFWFFAIGGLTVLMARGVSQRPSLPAFRPSFPRPAPAGRAAPGAGVAESRVVRASANDVPDDGVGSDDDVTPGVAEPFDVAEPVDVEDLVVVEDEPESEPAAGESRTVTRRATEAVADLDDVEDLMLIDGDKPGPQPPAGTG